MIYLFFLLISQFVAVASLNNGYQLVAHYTQNKQQYMAENVKKCKK